jgi:hypothetical protein
MWSIFEGHIPNVPYSNVRIDYISYALEKCLQLFLYNHLAVICVLPSDQRLMSLLLGAPCVRRAQVQLGQLPRNVPSLIPVNWFSSRATRPSCPPPPLSRQLCMTSARRSTTRDLQESVASRARNIVRRTTPTWLRSRLQLSEPEASASKDSPSESSSGSEESKQDRLNLSEVRKLIELGRPEKKTIGIAVGLVSKFVPKQLLRRNLD